MGSIIFFIILSAFSLMVCANDFLSKFHQTDYKIKDLFVKVIYVNYEYIEKFEIITFKYNRSVTAFNATTCPKMDSKRKVELLVQAYKRSSNAYVIFPVRFQVNFCKLFNKNIIGLTNVWKHGNVTSCQMKKGVVYHFYNFVIDESMLPPLIPTGEYKLETTAMYVDKIVAEIRITGEIYHPIATQ